jgi:hypothetical protein
MTGRQEIQARFVASFHIGNLRLPATDQQLDMIDVELNTRLPVSYRFFLTTYGTVHTPRILSEICDRNIDHADVQDFLAVNDIISDTKGYWSAGMPNDIIGVASDCMGNMIGFRRQAYITDDAPVLLFDHDFVAVHELAPSFDAFLLWYLDNLTGT